MIEQIERTELLHKVKTAVRAISPEAEIILYGSRAMGTANLESDWDFLIILPSPIDLRMEMEIKDRLYDIELETDTVLSSIIRSKREWLSSQYAVIPLRQQVESHGIAV